MATQGRTKRSTPRLSELARHVVVPTGVVSTGWPAVQDKCTELGITFRPWQTGGGKLILAKRADGKYASTIGGTGMSIPRQVGKTYLVAGIVFALCLLRPGLTVIWTAHRLRTAEETFGKMQVFAKRRLIAPHILKLILGSGEEEIRFRNGSRIMFGARERGFGRGFDEVDVLIYDEAQILGENALDDMVPATNQSRQDTGALLLFLGTPPKPTDNGEVFKRMRAEALSGEDHDTGWIEFGADPDYIPTPPPAPLSKADWVQVAKANPSYPDDTPRESILRMRKKLGAESFLREGLGIWDPDVHVDPDGLDVVAWDDCEDPETTAPLAVFAMSGSLDRTWGAIGAVGARADGLIHAEAERRGGVDWLVDEASRLDERHNHAAWIVDGKGPVRDLIPKLLERGLYVVGGDAGASTEDVAQAFVAFTDALASRALRHGPDGVLQAEMKAARRRPCGDGGFTFGRKKSTDAIPGIESIGLAVWGLENALTGPNVW